jgi:hypothetical protein
LNFEGVIHFELVLNNRAIEAELLFAQLDRIYAEMSRKGPTLVNRKRVLLQQDNASPHTARETKDALLELGAIEICSILLTARTLRHLIFISPGNGTFLAWPGTALESTCSPKDGFRP